MGSPNRLIDYSTHFRTHILVVGSINGCEASVCCYKVQSFSLGRSFQLRAIGSSFDPTSLECISLLLIGKL